MLEATYVACQDMSNDGQKMSPIHVTMKVSEGFPVVLSWDLSFKMDR